MINDIRGRTTSARRTFNSNSVPTAVIDPATPMASDPEMIPYRKLALEVIKSAVSDAGKRRPDGLAFCFHESSKADRDFWCGLLGVDERHLQRGARMAIKLEDARRMAAAMPLPTTVGDRGAA